MSLIELLGEYVQNKQAKSYNESFLPKFSNSDLPVSAFDDEWSSTNNLKFLKFSKREDMQDFVNALFEIEEDHGTFTKIHIDGTYVKIEIPDNASKRFLSLISEIANETSGHRR